MPRLWDKDSERLFKVLDDAGYVSWPANSSEAVVLLDSVATLIEHRGQKPVPKGRLWRLLYDMSFAVGTPMNIHEARSIADALGVDVRLLIYDAPPKTSTKVRSLLDELHG